MQLALSEVRIRELLENSLAMVEEKALKHQLQLTVDLERRGAGVRIISIHPYSAIKRLNVPSQFDPRLGFHGLKAGSTTPA